MLSSEGFYGPSSGKTWANPGPWATEEGQDFFQNARTQNIDYVGLHCWVRGDRSEGGPGTGGAVPPMRMRSSRQV